MSLFTGIVDLQAVPERLISYLVEEHSMTDPYYIEDFLLTYRTFLPSSKDITEHLLHWCADPSLRDRVSQSRSIYLVLGILIYDIFRCYCPSSGSCLLEHSFNMFSFANYRLLVSFSYGSTVILSILNRTRVWLDFWRILNYRWNRRRKQRSWRCCIQHWMWNPIRGR